MYKKALHKGKKGGVILFFHIHGLCKLAHLLGTSPLRDENVNPISQPS
jgi:hypothetical protein